MTPNEIFASVRMSPKIADNAGMKYSGYQMIDAFNDIMNVVYNTLSTMNSDLLWKKEDVYLDGGEGLLPDDFLMVVSVKDADGNALTPAGKSTDPGRYTYRIEGSNILSDNETLTVSYKPYFTDLRYDEIDDDLDIPTFFKPLLKRYLILSLTSTADNEDADVLQRLQSDVRQLVSGRGYTEVSVDTGDRGTWAGAI